MTFELRDAMEQMDRLIERMNNLNARGTIKTIEEALTASELRKQICERMDKVQLVILEELKKG
jgi:hypothetical protein